MLSEPTEPASGSAAADAPSPHNNLMLRQMADMRRDVLEAMERQARSIEQMNRLALRMEDGFTQMQEEFTRIRRTLRDMQGDAVLAENRVLTAVTEVRQLVARIEDAEAASGQRIGEP